MGNTNKRSKYLTPDEPLAWFWKAMQQAYIGSDLLTDIMGLGQLLLSMHSVRITLWVTKQDDT